MMWSSCKARHTRKQEDALETADDVVDVASKTNSRQHNVTTGLETADDVVDVASKSKAKAKRDGRFKRVNQRNVTTGLVQMMWSMLHRLSQGNKPPLKRVRNCR